MPPFRTLPAGLSRGQQKAQTEARILDAVSRLLEDGRLDEASYSEIARLAGVGERTVYRHFPTRDSLMGAFWARLQTEGLPPRKPSMRRVRESVRTEIDGRRPMRILIATDAWEPQVNGVVRTLTRVIAEMQAMGHTVEVISPEQFRGFPLPTYPEIKVAVGAYEPVRERFKAFEPEAIHIATEGPIGLAARRICVEWKLPFTTSYHTRFPEYVSARLPLPLSAGYAYMRWFHKPSGRLMVATPTMRDELAQHGFRNITAWSRGVDTEQFRPLQAGDPDVYEGLPRPIFLSVGRVAVEKNIEAFLALDLPGSKVVVGDGPQREELESRYPDAVFRGARFGEAMATGTPVAAYPAPGPIDIIPGSGAGVLALTATEGLREACLEALKLDRAVVRRFAEGFSWRACAEDFVRNLQPWPEPEKTRFWRRLRRLTRLRRRRDEA
jgi:glycosyltransferase involved in cell wall biosynthesis